MPEQMCGRASLACSGERGPPELLILRPSSQTPAPIPQICSCWARLGPGVPRGRAGVPVGRSHTHTPAHSDRLSLPQTGASMTSEPAVSMAGDWGRMGARGVQWARGLKLPLRPPPRTVAVSTFPSPSQVPPVSLCSHPPHASLCPAQHPVNPRTSLDTSDRREPRDPSLGPAAPKMQPCLAC